MWKIFVLNPGSTSTKLAVFHDDQMILEETIRHSHEELKNFSNVASQLEYRKGAVMAWLDRMSIPVSSFDAVAARGGILHPVASGTYTVNERMVSDLKTPKGTEHASNLAALVAYELAGPHNIPCYVTDPIVVDELMPEARIAGHPAFERISIFHALNQKAIARKAARDLGRQYDRCNLIVAHMGGGITVGAHYNGRTVDVNNGTDGEGPFTPERSGTLPMGDLARLCFSGKYTLQQIIRMLNGDGGMKAYIGEIDMRNVEKRIDSGDKQAELLFNAMTLQIAKEIGARSVVTEEKVDAVVLTGGLAYSKRLTDGITRKVSFIAPVMVYPGEDEASALAEGALRILNKEEEAKDY